jgi:predicted nucleic acid-binding protein
MRLVLDTDAMVAAIRSDAGASRRLLQSVLERRRGLTPVRLAYLWRPMLSDANDDMVLEVAVNGGAYGIVTFNRRDFDPSVKQFGILALSPGEAVRLLEKRP